MSDDKDYFADGLSEELLNLLANIPGLKVAGRTSSFAFKGKNDDLRGIGDALGVAYAISRVLTAGNFAFTLGLLDQALALDPEFAKAYEAKATYYWWGSGWTMDSPTAQVLAYEAASKALELDPGLTLARTFKATANPDSWSWIEGIEALEPLSAPAWWRAGEALSAAGRREEAQAAWARGVELGDGAALFYLGADQLIAGNDEAAINLYEKYYSWLGENPAEVRPFVENARHPETGKAFLDAWIAAAEAGASNFEEIRLPYTWYLVFGYLDDYWAAIDSLGNPDSGWSNYDVLAQEGLVYRASSFARHPEYLKHAAATGLFDLWDQRGAPDHCQKVDGDWVCE